MEIWYSRGGRLCCCVRCHDKGCRFPGLAWSLCRPWNAPLSLFSLWFGSSSCQPAFLCKTSDWVPQSTAVTCPHQRNSHGEQGRTAPLCGHTHHNPLHWVQGTQLQKAVMGKKKQGTKPGSFTEVTGFHVTSKLICSLSDLNPVVPPLWKCRL